MSYINTIINNPLDKLVYYYEHLSPSKQLQTLYHMNPSMLLLHRIVILLPKELILHIIHFLFNNIYHVKNYYYDHSIIDSITKYQYVNFVGDSGFELEPEEFTLIKDTKDATYITFEQYNYVLDINDELNYREILNENTYILPPAKYTYKLLSTFIFSMFILVIIMVGLIFSGVYLLKNHVIVFIFIAIICFLITFITIGFLYLTVCDCCGYTYKLKNMPI